MENKKETIVLVLQRIPGLKTSFSSESFLQWLNLSNVLEEMDLAIKLFNTIAKTNPARFMEEDLINSYEIAKNLQKEPLPDIKVFIKLLASSSETMDLVLKRIGGFEFIKTMQSEPINLFYSCLIELYSIYLSEINPRLKLSRSTLTQVLEEMLALRALYGIPTDLFYAIKPWILDYESEGFSVYLANKINEI